MLYYTVQISRQVPQFGQLIVEANSEDHALMKANAALAEGLAEVEWGDAEPRMTEEGDDAQELWVVTGEVEEV